MVPSSYLIEPIRSCAVLMSVLSVLSSATSGTSRPLQRADVLELLLRVGHLLREPVACGLERVELRAARQLHFQLVDRLPR